MGLKPNAKMEDLMNTAEMAQGDPAKAMMKLLGGSGDNANFPANLIRELNKWFIPICVKSCTVGMEPGNHPVTGEELLVYKADYPFRSTYWAGYKEWEECPEGMPG